MKDFFKCSIFFILLINLYLINLNNEMFFFILQCAPIILDYNGRKMFLESIVLEGVNIYEF